MSTNISLRIATKDDIFLPAYATPGSAGMDIKAAITEPITIASGQTVKIPCGFALELPDNVEAQIRPRSGLAAKHGITVLNAPGTIDPDFRGEVCVLLHNTSSESFEVEPQMRIAQMVIAPFLRVSTQTVTFESLQKSTRQDGGFGSTGL